jgi:NADP-dependent 3-hydroxy acid dehydrogenase YdfG
VGSGICRRFLEAGARVAAPQRSNSSLGDALDELVGLRLAKQQLDTPIIDYGTPEGAQRLAAHLERAYGRGGVDVVVSCVGGGFAKGRLSELTPQDVHDALGRALPHMLLAQALAPLLREAPSSCYVFVTGMLGEVCSMPGAAALSIANAAIYGIVRAMEAEFKDRPLRINEVRTPQAPAAPCTIIQNRCSLVFLNRVCDAELPSTGSHAPQLRIAALLRKDSKPGHPFVANMPAFPATLIGDVAVAVAAGRQRGEIVRVRAADLEPKMAAYRSRPRESSDESLEA